jgi:hypothetical protein
MSNNKELTPDTLLVAAAGAVINPKMSDSEFRLFIRSALELYEEPNKIMQARIARQKCRKTNLEKP